MLIARDDELARVAALIAASAGGDGGVLVVGGAVGVGRTALVDEVVSRARTGPPVTVLRVSCLDSEAELAFAGLGDLLRPLHDRLSLLPSPQAAALSSALALAPPSDDPVNPFAIAAGTLEVLVRAGADTPVLAVVDDAQWLDSGSAAALLFVARRLAGQRVALLVTVRDGEPSAFAGAGLPLLTLSTLDRAAASTMVGPLLADEPQTTVDTLYAQTHGNPLALLELAVLVAAQGVGALGVGAPGDGTGPAPVGPRLDRAYRHQLDALPRSSRAALLVAAASWSGGLAGITGALRVTGADPRILEQSEASGLILVGGGRVTFRHPILRSVAYHCATLEDRRAAHRALAVALVGATRIADVEERAWHLAGGASGVDDEAAAALEDVAVAARRRGALVAARTAYERAADLSGDPAAAARRLFAAALAAAHSGDLPAASALLTRARDDSTRPTGAGAAGAGAVAAGAGAVAAGAIATGGSMASLHGQLRSAAAAADKAGEPGPAVASLLTAAAGAAVVAGLISAGLTAAEDARGRTSPADGEVWLAATAMLAHNLTLAGEHERARSLLAELPRLSGGGSQADPPAHDSEVLAFVALVLGWLGDPADGAEVVEHGVTAARATGATERLPMLLSVGAELRRRAGDWDAAEALGVECGQIEKARPELPPQAYGHTALAWIAAARGDGPAVIRHAGAVSQLFTGFDAALARWLTEGPLALLELSVGDDAAVVDRLSMLLSVTTARGLGDPSVLPFHGDLVEAALRRGRRDLAEQAVEALRPAVEPPRPALLAVRDRCLALLAADTGAAGEAEAHFLEALRRHALGTERFEAARTQLCYGEWLRRTRRTTDARTLLIAARETFAALRAGPWTERADQALRLSGGRRRPATTGGPDHIRLTEQETQVAALVGGGASNREAAAALFISAKTVEYHLGNIYAKVGLRSRTQLAAWLRSPAGAAGDT